MNAKSKQSQVLKPSTDKRADPRQFRSNKTVDLILKSASEMLMEVGFEKLSTNVICKRAGLTPPALYRYFPNKYAVLKELGERLMGTQNEALEEWILADISEENLEMRMLELLEITMAVTQADPASAWIMRSLHASPHLSEVRLNSHRLVSQALTERFLQIWPEAPRDRIYSQIRLSVEISYSVVEMLFDDHELDAQTVMKSTAKIITINIKNTLIKPHKK
ncbi:MAG: TetR/AcrR family transcriptional regulator [Sneathiella sp.]